MTYEPPAAEVAIVEHRHPHIRVTLWWLGAVAVFLAIILEVGAILAGVMLAATLHGIADNLSRLDPAPASPTAPLPQDQCGGGVCGD